MWIPRDFVEPTLSMFCPFIIIYRFYTQAPEGLAVGDSYLVIKYLCENKMNTN